MKQARKLITTVKEHKDTPIGRLLSNALTGRMTLKQEVFMASAYSEYKIDIRRWPQRAIRNHSAWPAAAVWSLFRRAMREGGAASRWTVLERLVRAHLQAEPHRTLPNTGHSPTVQPAPVQREAEPLMTISVTARYVKPPPELNSSGLFPQATTSVSALSPGASLAVTNARRVHWGEVASICYEPPPREHSFFSDTDMAAAEADEADEEEQRTGEEVLFDINQF
eukprot:gnl/Dysnectes_brevis/5627_a8204_401.p1 GENE.gnl/Dysnectes_brevis/5627_a8204_401~~gnl/Dysnectes_brevis/5627_a8204_401.p1  ORF type:complete len:224 (+),score=53.12 gnl/Dysnectes_brevis/5627_a8204_401:295-966(+)